MLNTVEYFRNKYGNYAKDIVNEERYNKNGDICNIVYYPLNNLYYNMYNKDFF